VAVVANPGVAAVFAVDVRVVGVDVMAHGKFLLMVGDTSQLSPGVAGCQVLFQKGLSITLSDGRYNFL
jgi:phage tail protein X